MQQSDSNCWIVVRSKAMNCKRYWEKTFGDSSIHGFPYLVRRDLHWAEKVFWITIILLAGYFSINICLNQWKRFRENPIVYAMELAWVKSNFPFVGITMCSEAATEAEMAIIIREIWHVTDTKNMTQYQYYMEFLQVLNSLNFLNLQKLEPYGNDSSLNNLNFVELLMTMRRNFLPTKQYPEVVNRSTVTESAVSSIDVDSKEQMYAAAMTEMGVCRTTSQLTRYTNPYGEFKTLKVSPSRYCNIMNECNTKIFPKVDDTSGLLIFLHNVEDIVTPYDKNTIMRHATTDGSLTIELLLSLTTAENEVRNLPIAYRKCRYKDENNLKYFETYRPGLCRIECRINVAMRKCGCKPYFYIVALHVPVCTIKGMLCLAKEHWPKTAQCNCPNLCEEETYISMQTTTQKDESTKLESTVIIKLFLPRMAMIRRVVFSTDQLIVSFGGAIGLFLGASFISLYGLLYVLSEYAFSNVWSILINKKLAKKRVCAQKRLTLVREMRPY